MYVNERERERERETWFDLDEAEVNELS